jgi:hypothetical protein
MLLLGGLVAQGQTECLRRKAQYQYYGVSAGMEVLARLAPVCGTVTGSFKQLFDGVFFGKLEQKLQEGALGWQLHTDLVCCRTLKMPDPEPGLVYDSSASIQPVQPIEAYFDTVPDNEDLEQDEAHPQPPPDEHEPALFDHEGEAEPTSSSRQHTPTD